jgi:hypothetical protein
MKGNIFFIVSLFFHFVTLLYREFSPPSLSCAVLINDVQVSVSFTPISILQDSLEGKPTHRHEAIQRKEDMTHSRELSLNPWSFCSSIFILDHPAILLGNICVIFLRISSCLDTSSPEFSFQGKQNIVANFSVKGRHVFSIVSDILAGGKLNQQSEYLTNISMVRILSHDQLPWLCFLMVFFSLSRIVVTTVISLCVQNHSGTSLSMLHKFSG